MESLDKAKNIKKVAFLKNHLQEAYDNELHSELWLEAQQKMIRAKPSRS